MSRETTLKKEVHFTDHLGSVRATWSEPEERTATDYNPFGSVAMTHPTAKLYSDFQTLMAKTFMIYVYSIIAVIVLVVVGLYFYNTIQHNRLVTDLQSHQYDVKETIYTIKDESCIQQYTSIKSVSKIFPCKNEFGATIMTYDEFRKYKPEKWKMDLQIGNDVAELTGVFLWNYGEIEGSDEVFLFYGFYMALYPSRERFVEVVKYCIANKKTFSSIVLDYFPYKEDFYNYTDALIAELESLTNMEWKDRYERADLQRLDSVISKNDNDLWHSTAYAPLVAYVYKYILHEHPKAVRAVRYTTGGNTPHEHWNNPEVMLIVNRYSDTERSYLPYTIVFRAVHYDNYRSLSESLQGI